MRPFAAKRTMDYPAMPAPIRSRKIWGTCHRAPRQVSTADNQIHCRYFEVPPGALPQLRRLLVFFSWWGAVYLGVQPRCCGGCHREETKLFVKGVGFERAHKSLGKGLLTSEESVHLRHRRMMQPPFQHRQLDEYARVMCEIVHAHIEAWKVNQEVSANEKMMRVTLQIVAQLLFSAGIHRYAEGVQHHMGVAIDRIERTMLPGLDRFDKSPLPYFGKFKESSEYLADAAEDILSTRVARGTHGTDLPGLLLDARDDANQALSHDDVRDETLTLILSDHETTANVMTSALAYLRDRDDLWDLVKQEAATYTPE